MAGSRSWDDIGYREAIENCRTWNAQMGHGRRERLPFFDDHTQVHQVSMNQLDQSVSRTESQLKNRSDHNFV